MNGFKKLNEIQQKLKVPKTQFNKFGGFRFRNAEGILAAVKPLLGDMCIITSYDSKVDLGVNLEYHYIQATVYLYDTDGSLVTKSVGIARQANEKKGMDESQRSGTASSYAHKMALGGMFAIDGSDIDPDQLNNGESKPELKPNTETWDIAVKSFGAGNCTIDGIREKYYLSEPNKKKLCLESEQVPVAK
tara:strand:- start:461 stop:1030 length:570 start_codon:yes stop_codon:yes gene_type:complete